MLPSPSKSGQQDADKLSKGNSKYNTKAFPFHPIPSHPRNNYFIYFIYLQKNHYLLLCKSNTFFNCKLRKFFYPDLSFILPQFQVPRFTLSTEEVPNKKSRRFLFRK